MHDCTHTTDTDRKLEAGLREAFRPLMDAASRPPRLVLRSTELHDGVLTASIEIDDTDVCYWLHLPLAEPGRATLHLVSG